MKTKDIFIGYETKTGEKVEMFLSHLIFQETTIPKHHIKEIKNEI